MLSKKYFAIVVTWDLLAGKISCSTKLSIKKSFKISGPGLKIVSHMLHQKLSYMLWLTLKITVIKTEIWVSHKRIYAFDLNTTHPLISAHSSNFVVFKLELLYFHLLLYKGICFWYSFELPWQVKAIQMSTNNICFYKKYPKKYKYHKPLSCWTQIYLAFANNVDPDQLVSEKADWSGSAIKNVNLYQQSGSINLIGWKLEKGVAS